MSRRKDLFGKTLFVDLMMSTLVVVTALLIASNAVERAKKQHESLQTEGLFAIVATWPDEANDDVDLYVRDPRGGIAYFNAREIGGMHLEQDDRAFGSGPQKHIERVIIRGALEGEYTVNVQMFAKHAPLPTTVKIRLVSLKGEDADLIEKTKVLDKDGDEETAFRFTLSADGNASDFNELPRRLTGNDAVREEGGP